MDVSLEKECSGLGGLFQSIINDLKGGYPIWDDFAQKTTKMHIQLKAAVAAINVFLDALQRVADLATNAKGATRDIGTALTRICMRHRSIENRMKTLTSSLIDCLVLPLQEKLDDWRKTVLAMDKDHSREYKRARAEIKKRSVDTDRLQKKIRKGHNSVQRMLDSAVQEVNDRYYMLLETERQAVRQALVEQRSQFCIFVSWFKPVMDGELSLLNEVSQLQEVVDLLCKHSADPFTLPAASEAVITDVKGLENTWRFQTPPSSPGSSLGSRKSSFCSLTNVDQMSQVSSHNQRQPPMLVKIQNAPPSPRFSSISSQDSGFTSQDALFHAGCLRSSQPVQVGEKPSVSDDEESTAESYSGSQQSTPSPSPSVATWPDGGNGAASAVQRLVQIPSAVQRPHTISATYTGQGTKRPSLNTATFLPPRPTELMKEMSKTKRSSSQDPAFQRPPLPYPLKATSSIANKPGGVPPTMTKVGTMSAATTPLIPDFNFVQPNQIIPQPIYANADDLKQSKATTGQLSLDKSMDDAIQPIIRGTNTIVRQRPRRPLSFASSTDDASSFLTMALDGQYTMKGCSRDDDEDTLIGECMDQIDHASSDLDQYFSRMSMKSTSNDANVSLDLPCRDLDRELLNLYGTLPRYHNGSSENGMANRIQRIHPPQLTSISSVLTGGPTTPIATTMTSNIFRRSSMSVGPPQPPQRRNSAITAATPTAPAVDIIRSRCTSPDEPTYAIASQNLGRHSMIGSIEQTGRILQLPLQKGQIEPSQQIGMVLTSRGCQLRTDFRASSEPPIQENTILFAQQLRFIPAPATKAITSTRENLLMEIRKGVRLKSTANGESNCRTQKLA